MDMKDTGIFVFGNSFTSNFQTNCQIMIAKHIKSPNMLQRSTMGAYGGMGDMPYMSYIRDMVVCQVSSYPAAKGRGMVNIPDTKHSIYKHYISKHHMFDMADMRI